MEKNDLITMTAEDVNETGDGICRHEGMVVFCRGLLPGETANVRIIKICSSYAIGKVIERLTDSPDRTEPGCGYFTEGCGGCSFCHYSYDAQLKSKRRHIIDCLVRIGGLEQDKTENICGPAEGEERGNDGSFYGRNKTAYPFVSEKDSSGNTTVKCGFYGRNSHRVIPLKSVTENDISGKCLMESVISAKIRSSVCDFANLYGLSVYNEKNGKGLLRHLVVRTGDSSGTVMLILVISQSSFRQEKELVTFITEKYPEITSVWLNINKKDTNVIYGESFRKIFGNDKIINAIGEAEYAISPQSFFQTNTHQAEALYRNVYDFAAIEPGEKILDLYCGTGTIGLYILKRFLSEHPDYIQPDEPGPDTISLAGIEIVDSAIADAKENADRNGISNCVFICADAFTGIEYLFSAGFKPTTIILDPPRKGCDAGTLNTVAAANPSKIVYVSCNPSTLARDISVLADFGYTPVAVRPVDMFPMTAHVETVVLLSKLGEAKHHVTVELKTDELDLTPAEAKASYEEIREYVKQKYSLTVSDLNIAQVKRKHGIIERENYNLSKSSDSKQPQYTPEKETAITEALRYFKMI